MGNKEMHEIEMLQPFSGACVLRYEYLYDCHVYES